MHLHVHEHVTLISGEAGMGKSRLAAEGVGFQLIGNAEAQSSET